MKPSWRRLAAAITVALFAASLAGAGYAVASIASVQIDSPTTGAPQYAKAGTTTAAMAVTVAANPGDVVYLDSSVGSSPIATAGPQTVGASGHVTFTSVVDISGAAEGWMDAHASARLGPPGSPSTDAVQVRAVCMDKTAPVISGWTPVSGTTLPNRTHQVFTVQIADPTAGVSAIAPSLSGGGTITSRSYNQTTGTATIVLDDLAYGPHTLRLVASDRSGNDASEAVDFVVDDTVKPVIDEMTWDPLDNCWLSDANCVVSVGVRDAAPSSGINSASITVASDLGGGAISSSYTGGRIRITVANPSEGAHWLRVGVSDSKPNTSDEKTFRFNVDRHGPVFSDPKPVSGLETNNTSIAPSIIISDSGARLAPNSVIWTMTGPAGVAVIGQPTWDDASSKSTFVPDRPISADGAYVLSVSAQDRIGNTSAYPAIPSSWGFLLDTVAPGLRSWQIEGPVYENGGVVYTAATQPKVKVTVIDNPGGSGLNDATDPLRGHFRVRVYADSGMQSEVVGDTAFGLRPTANSGEWAAEWWPNAVMPDGDYYVKVEAVDDAGNEASISSTSSGRLVFVVDSSPPSAFGEAAVGNINTANGARFTNSRAPLVSWDASTDPSSTDGVSGSGLHGYELQVWTKSPGDTIPTGSKLWEAPSGGSRWPVMPTGTGSDWCTVGNELPFRSGVSYGAWIRAWDMVENGSAWFDPPFTFDGDAPSDPGAPDVAGLGTGRRIASTMPTLVWTHSTDQRPGQAQSGVDGYEVKIRRFGSPSWDVVNTFIDIDDEDVDDAPPPAPADVPLSGTIAWKTTPLADGEYEVRIRARDVAGNTSGWVSIADPSCRFAVDTTPPAVPGTPTTTTSTCNPRPTWDWEEVDGAAGYRVFLDGAAVALGVTQSAAAWTPSFDLSEGSHYIRIAAVDKPGNESGKSQPGYVVVDTIGPEVTVVSPASVVMTNSSTVTWEWSATDVGTGVKGYWFTFDDWASRTWTTDAALVRTVDAGDHILRVRAEDRAGAIGPDAVFPDVTVVGLAVRVLSPPEGSYRINEVSTIEIEVIGLVDARISVTVNAVELDAAHVVTMGRTRRCVLIDETVFAGGPTLTLVVSVGGETARRTYIIVPGRTGFGFGRIHL
ncbi:MAG: Ig-like domain repeat protein [Clostridia bacterium]|nr:Ig-like domain repeat protein [Clostridia bacterium]